MARKAKEQEPEILEIDGVPTVAGLARKSRDLAYIRPDGRWHVTAAGHEEMGAAMRANAQEAIMRGEDRWTRPPSSGPILGG